MNPLDQLLTTWRKDADHIKLYGGKPSAADILDQCADELAAALAVQIEGKTDQECPECGGSGNGPSTAEHGCDGTDESCTRVCPIEVPQSCSTCGGSGLVCAAEMSSDIRTPQAPSGELYATLERAHRVVCDLSQGKQKWRMSIPARPDTDPDLIIGAALRDAMRYLRPDAAQANRMSDGIPAAVTVIPMTPELQAALDQAETTQEPKR